MWFSPSVIEFLCLVQTLYVIGHKCLFLLLTVPQVVGGWSFKNDLMAVIQSNQLRFIVVRVPVHFDVLYSHTCTDTSLTYHPVSHRNRKHWWRSRSGALHRGCSLLLNVMSGTRCVSMCKATPLFCLCFQMVWQNLRARCETATTLHASQVY